MPSQQSLVGPRQPVLRQMADHFKQRRAHIIVKIFGGKFLLSRPSQTRAYIGSEFINNIAGDRMNEHREFLKSEIDAAKSGIHVLVMPLEPVAEAGAQHAASRTRRAAFHDEVLAIEEIGRVAAIKRERLESAERRELCRRPLPSVTHHTFHSKRALTLRIGINGRRIPSLKIKISKS